MTIQPTTPELTSGHELPRTLQALANNTVGPAKPAHAPVRRGPTDQPGARVELTSRALACHPQRGHTGATSGPRRTGLQRITTVTSGPACQPTGQSRPSTAGHHHHPALPDTEAVMELSLVVTVDRGVPARWSQAVQAALRSVRAGSVSQRSSTGMSGHQRSPTVRRNRRSLPFRLTQLR